MMLGLSMAGMNLFFYLALRTIPVGQAMAIELTGPLLVAAVASRRCVDLVCVGAAATGLVLMLSTGLHSILDLRGLLFALAAAGSWGSYLILGQRSPDLRGDQVLALALTVAAVILVPIGVFSAGTKLLNPRVALIGLGVAVVAGAAPYALEFFALRRLRRETVGILLSAEPAAGSLVAFLLLGERLSPLQLLAIAAIVGASMCTMIVGPKMRTLPLEMTDSRA